MKRKFVAYFWFNGWSNINLGISISLQCPNIEFHVPFGFIRIGWVETYFGGDVHWVGDGPKAFGYDPQ